MKPLALSGWSSVLGFAHPPMTSIDDLAEDTGDIYLARNAAGMRFRLKSRDTTPCDSLGTDSFPQYGDFVPVETWHPPEGRYVDDCWLEVTRELAKVLVDYGIGAGDEFEIEDVNKDSEGVFYFTVNTDV